MTDTQINDIRILSDFFGMSFSGFKKADVKKELIGSFMAGRVENACYWSGELICAGHFGDLWEIIIFFYGYHIHLGNPKLAIFLDRRVKTFIGIMKNGYADGDIKMRNSNKIRQMFAEICCIICYAKRKPEVFHVKVPKGDFDLTTISEKFKAPTITYGNIVFKEEDPKEIFIAVNEFAFNLCYETRHSLDAFYWMEWIFQFDHICRDQKKKLLCARRSQFPVNYKYQMDPVWIVWDTILESSKGSNPLILSIIDSIMSLYLTRYTPAAGKKRKYLLYFAIAMITEKVDLDESILKDTNKPQMDIVISNIESIYKQIKTNEKSPTTNYLFQEGAKTNMDKTIAKLDQMNLLGNTFIPRI